MSETVYRNIGGVAQRETSPLACDHELQEVRAVAGGQVSTGISSPSPIDPGVDRAQRAWHVRHQLHALHQAMDDSDIRFEKSGMLYFTWKAFAAAMERGGRDLLAITERQLSDLTGRDRKETYYYVQRLLDRGLLERKEEGRGGPEYPPDEWQSAVYGLTDRPLSSYMEVEAEAYHWQDCQMLLKSLPELAVPDYDDGQRAAFIPGFDPDHHLILDDLIPSVIDRVTDTINGYEYPKVDLTSYTHHYPQDCLCGVRIYVPNSHFSTYSDNSHVHHEGSDGPARWTTEYGVFECSIPHRPAATSPLDYLTASKHWVEGEAGVGGWLIARSLVRWNPSPEPFRRSANTLSTAAIANITGWASKNVSARLRPLVERGYARQTAGGWYFIFEDLYRQGWLFQVDERQQRLRLKNAGKKNKPLDRIARPRRRTAHGR
jgi:hypothetical protein